MEFKLMYKKVEGIVRRCEKDYYIQLWRREDWEQEGMLVLYLLLEQHPELYENENKLYVYYKTKFRNYVHDVIRKQESQKRKLNRMLYEEVSEVGHNLYQKSLSPDEQYLLQDALRSYQRDLSPTRQECYEKLLANERFKGRKQMIQELRGYLSDWSD